MPLHVYYMGTSWSLIGVFVFYLAATGLSITGGYHRLFAHPLTTATITDL
jgi:fatty-acid desaturase